MRRTRSTRSRRKPVRRAPRGDAPKLALPPAGRVIRFAAIALVVAGLAAGAAVGARAVWTRLAAQPSMAVTTVEVEGAVHADPADLLALAGVAPGDSWLALDREGVARRLRGHPWVASARVRRPGPGRVRLAVEECVPLARVHFRGRTYGVGADLRILPGVADEGLPLVEAPEVRGKARLDPAALAEAVEYVRGLAESGAAADEPYEIEVHPGAVDRLRFPARGVEVRVEESVTPRAAARNAWAFLETLDGTGVSRGTLRVISEETAVWKPQA